MGTVHSYLQVINNTNQDIVKTSVYSCANFDWRGNSRPDRNFQGHRIIARGGSITQKADLKKRASHCPFNMKLTFQDGAVDEFRIHQKFVQGCCSGFNHMKRFHDISYHSVNGNMLVIKVKNTAQQLQNQKAEENSKEGEALMKQKQYEAALKKFDEALGIANQGSTISTIKISKSRACNEFGKECMQKAWDFEADTIEDKSKEAESKFDQAKHLFHQALGLQNLSEYQENSNIVNLKIEGNQLFNEANDLEQEAFKLFKSRQGGNTAAQNKYKGALVKYKEAMKKFEGGANINHNKFDESVKITVEHINAVNKVIDDIDQSELNHNIGKVNVEDEEKEKNEDEQGITINLLQQVDAV